MDWSARILVILVTIVLLGLLNQLMHGVLQSLESDKTIDTHTPTSLEERCSHKLLTPAAAPVDHTPNRFLLEPSAACAGHVFLLVFVHSAVYHRDRRDLIRRTWGSVSNIHGNRISTFFVLGTSSSKKEMQQVQLEAEETADLLQADFVDAYRNLTYKQLYAIKWISQNCRSVRFVMKVDDDIVLNVFNLHNYLRDTMMSERNFILCEKCIDGCWPLRHKRYKWRVSMKEWPLKYYPAFCFGMGYVISAEVMLNIHLCAKWRKFLWLDDVFVSGTLAEALGVKRLQFEEGWEVHDTHPMYVGQKVRRVVFLLARKLIRPRLHEQVWDSMVQHRL